MFEYRIDLDELLKQARWVGKQTTRYARVRAQMLTEFAYGTRREILRLLGKRMIIRNRRFVEGRVVVSHATVSGQRSRVGTIPAKRFSGWTEQELGEKTKRTRTSTLFSRGGSKGRQVIGRFRLKPERDVVKPSDVGLVGRQANFIQMMKRVKERKLIMIKGAIVKLYRKALKTVHHIKPQNLQPKKRPFLQTSRRMYFKSVNMEELLKKVLRYIKE